MAAHSPLETLAPCSPGKLHPLPSPKVPRRSRLHALAHTCLPLDSLPFSFPIYPPESCPSSASKTSMPPNPSLVATSLTHQHMPALTLSSDSFLQRLMSDCLHPRNYEVLRMRAVLGFGYQHWTWCLAHGRHSTHVCWIDEETDGRMGLGEGTVLSVFTVRTDLYGASLPSHWLTVNSVCFLPFTVLSSGGPSHPAQFTCCPLSLACPPSPLST